MTGWWTQLSDRDRRVLLVGAVLAGVLLAWAFIWQPMQSRRSLLVEQLDNAHRDLAFVRVGEAEVEHAMPCGAQRLGNSCRGQQFGIVALAVVE